MITQTLNQSCWNKITGQPRPFWKPLMASLIAILSGNQRNCGPKMKKANRLRIIEARVNATNLYLSSRRSKKKCKKITVNTATLQCYIGLMRNLGQLKKRLLKLTCLIKWSADTNSTTGKKLRISSLIYV